jgi:hypothetical protein
VYSAPTGPGELQAAEQQIAGDDSVMPGTSSGESERSASAAHSIKPITAHAGSLQPKRPTSAGASDVDGFKASARSP